MELQKFFESDGQRCTYGGIDIKNLRPLRHEIDWLPAMTKPNP